MDDVAGQSCLAPMAVSLIFSGGGAYGTITSEVQVGHQGTGFRYAAGDRGVRSAVTCVCGDRPLSAAPWSCRSSGITDETPSRSNSGLAHIYSISGPCICPSSPGGMFTLLSYLRPFRLPPASQENRYWWAVCRCWLRHAYGGRPG
jgi:hypothetical protein